MQKHPLLSVKEAAEMLRLDERSIRERLINGQLKGEKRSIGLREKWFVYSGSVEAALAKQQGGFVGDPIGLTDVAIESELVEELVEQDEQKPNAAKEPEDDRWLETNRDRVQALAAEFLKPLADKIEAQAEMLVEQRRTIADQERQIRLLPDLQKQAEERARQLELEHVEKEALKKQVAALNAEKAQLEIQLAAAFKRSFWQKLIGSK